jgi:hypothetical protein
VAHEVIEAENTYHMTSEACQQKFEEGKLEMLLNSLNGRVLTASISVTNKRCGCSKRNWRESSR